MTPSGAGPPIIHVAAELGQGGTERSIELLATSAAGPAGQRGFALDRGGAAAGPPLRGGGGGRLFAGGRQGGPGPHPPPGPPAPPAHPPPPPAAPRGHPTA